MSASLQPHGLYSPWDFPGWNTGVGSLSLLQGIFPTQGSNPGLPHCRRTLYQLSHKGSPRILEWVAEEWIKKAWYTYTMEYYSAVKKNEVMPYAARWMQLDCPSQSTKSERERQIPHDIMCICNLKQWYKWLKVQSWDQLIVREQTCSLQGGWEQETDRVFGVSGCKLLYVGWINKELYTVSCDKP